MTALRHAYSELSNLSVLNGSKASRAVLISCSLGSLSLLAPEESDNAQNTESKSNISRQLSSKRMTWSRKGSRLKHGSLRPNLRETVRRRQAASWRGSEEWNERGSTAWWSSDILIWEGWKCLCAFLKDANAVEAPRWSFVTGSEVENPRAGVGGLVWPFCWMDGKVEGGWNLCVDRGVAIVWRDWDGTALCIEFELLSCDTKVTRTGPGIEEAVIDVRGVENATERVELK